MEHLVTLLEALVDGAPRTLTTCAQLCSLADWAPDAFDQRVLREHGVENCSLAGQPALQMTRPPSLLSSAAIRATLTAAASAATRRLDVVFTTDSTNARLLDRARHDAIEGHVLTAEHQSAGRGRRGKQWQSPVASNIYLSLGYEFARLEELQCLSLFIGVGVVEALAAMGCLDVALKWPNDVIWAGRKLAGILIESSPNSRGGISVVVGIGVNVQVPAYAAEAIDQPFADLAQAVGGPVDRNAVCGCLISSMDAVIRATRRGERSSLLARYGHLDLLRDRPVQVRIGDRVVNGVARGISADGELQVVADGTLVSFNAGEVSVRDAAVPPPR